MKEKETHRSMSTWTCSMGSSWTPGLTLCRLSSRGCRYLPSFVVSGEECLLYEPADPGLSLQHAPEKPMVAACIYNPGAGGREETAHRWEVFTGCLLVASLAPGNKVESEGADVLLWPSSVLHERIYMCAYSADARVCAHNPNLLRISLY